MNRRKFSLRSIFASLFRKREVPPTLRPMEPVKPTSARERVRSGIEVLEGRIAPAVLLNAHTLSYTDIDGDTVRVTFSKDIFDLNAASISTTLANAFKFTAGKAHLGAANATDDVPQQLQLIDLGQVPAIRVGTSFVNRVGGVSITITSDQNPSSGLPLGDGLAAIGAIKSGTNGLGNVVIDGDLGQIDAGTGASKIGVNLLMAQSIGKFGTTTQQSSPTPDLNSVITGKLGRLIVFEDVKGFISVVDATRTQSGATVITQRGTIGQVTILGSLVGNATVGTASDNTGRIQSSYDIGNVSIGTDPTEGLVGGGGNSAGSIFAQHALGNVTISGNVSGGAGQDSGVIRSAGSMGAVKIGGDLVGGSGVRSGSLSTTTTMGDVTINKILGGSAENSGLVASGTSMGNVHIFSDITGAGGVRSGGIFANGALKSVVVDGTVTGGLGDGSGVIEGLKSVGATLIRGNLVGADGVGSGSVIAGGTLARITVVGDVRGGDGANSGSIFGANDTGIAGRTVGSVTIGGHLVGGEGISSGAIVSGASLGAVRIGTALTSGLAVEGGLGALSGAIFANGTIASVATARGITGGAGAGSASIQADGTIGSVSIIGDLTGGSGFESASIFSHDKFTLARPIAGNIGAVGISGTMVGVGERSAMIEAEGILGRVTVGGIDGGGGASSASIQSGTGLVRSGPTTSITVNGAVEGGAGLNSGSVLLSGQLGAFTANSLLNTAIRVGDDLAPPRFSGFVSLRINGDVTGSTISARGQVVNSSTSDLAIHSVFIQGDFIDSEILAGYDVQGEAVNADAQIGTVMVRGNWVASNIVAGVEAGTDGVFGTGDDAVISGSNSARIVSQIARIVVFGTVSGTTAPGDHFGFVAETVGAFSANGVPLRLTATRGQVFEIPGTGATNDTTVREVASA